MRNIVLVGFMGTGKTAVAAELSKRLNMPVLNLDDMIEKNQKKSINEIFREYGEPYFRKVEKKITKVVSQRQGVIIDAGGGVVLNEENIKNLKQNGILFCLNASADIILKRTKEYNTRPLLNVDNPKKQIEELLKKRAPFYAKADFSIDTSDKSISQVADIIIKKYESR